MTTVRYEIIGEHSAPYDFMENAYRTLLARNKQIHLVAQRISVDDLAARRGDVTTQIEFDFGIVMTDHTTDIPSVSGYMYTNGERGNWIMLQVDSENNHVWFDLFD